MNSYWYEYIMSIVLDNLFLFWWFLESLNTKDVYRLVFSRLVFFCSVLYCLVFFCSVLYCLVLSCLFLFCIVLCCLVLCCLVLSCPISSSLLSFPVWFFSYRLLLNWIANSMHLLMDRRQQERRQLQRMVKVTSNQLFDIIQSGNRSRVNVLRSRLRHRRFTIWVMRAGR